MCPFGVGDPFTIVVPADVTTCHGNVSVPAGTYEAWQSETGQEGTVVVWSPEHYAAPIWSSLTAWLWTFPGESARPVPEHECSDNLRSGVAGGVFCSICHKEA